MAKCTKCGKFGFFLKLENGLCKSCAAVITPAPRKSIAFEPITKPRELFVDLLPVDAPESMPQHIRHFDPLKSVLIDGRVRLDYLSSSSVGYLPSEIAKLCMAGHIASVHFCEYVDPPLASGCAGKIARVRIWLVPSGGAIPTPPPDPLDVQNGSRWIYPKVINDCSIAYWYPSVPVAEVNREKLRELVSSKQASFDAVEVSVELAANGDILLSHDGVIMGKVLDRQQMCADWLHKNLLLRCVFSSYKKGEETVALAFYKDDRQRYSTNKAAVVKLISYKNEEAQFGISEMHWPEKLKVDEYDGHRVLDIYNSNIGRLPAKFQRLYDEGEVEAIYFDHYDTVADEETGEDIYVPFVRLFICTADCLSNGPRMKDTEHRSLNDTLVDATSRSGSSGDKSGQEKTKSGSKELTS